jgi:hypothetical protein
MPTAPPPDAAGLLPADGVVVTVFPLGVFAVVVAGGLFFGAGELGRGVVFGVEGRGDEVFGAGAAGVFGATSFNCGCAALSRFASARSRFNVESDASAALSAAFESERHAASIVSEDTAANARGVAMRRVYFVMGIPPLVS